MNINYTSTIGTIAGKTTKYLKMINDARVKMCSALDKIELTISEAISNFTQEAFGK